MSKIEYTVAAGTFPFTHFQKSVFCRSMKQAVQTAQELIKEGYPVINIYVRDMKTINAIHEARDAAEVNNEW